jgi:hypothetical protein
VPNNVGRPALEKTSAQIEASRELCSKSRSTIFQTRTIVSASLETIAYSRLVLASGPTDLHHEGGGSGQTRKSEK